MSLLGEHGGFILASYLAALFAIGGLLIATVLDYRTQARRLADLEARGVTRRSKAAAPKTRETRPDWDTP